MTTLSMSQGPYCTECDAYIKFCVMLRTPNIIYLYLLFAALFKFKSSADQYGHLILAPKC